MKRVLAGIAAIAAIAIAPGTAQADGHVDITLLHGIPGATVDVAVDGDVVVPAFEPGDTADLTALAGQTLSNVEVRAAGTEDVVIGPVAEFPVPDEGSWTVLAHLDADGNPTITPFANDDSPASNPGDGRLTIRHAAAAPAVDVVLGDARPVENAANGDEAVLDLPAGDVAGAQIAPTGGDPIADVPTVTVTAGKNLIVYAVGSLEGGTFTFYTQEIDLEVEESPTADAAAGDGTPAPTAVNTGEPVSDAVNAAVLAAAAGMLILAGGSFALRRRTVQD